jgi:hypothetical protein
LEKDRNKAGALGGGIAVSFVFLELMPELDHGHELVGELIEFVVLGGFVLVYGLNHLAHRRSGSSIHFFSIQLGVAAVYNWLLVYSFPRSNDTHDMATAALLVVHLLFFDHSLRRSDPAAYDRWGRWVLALSSMLGWVALISVDEQTPMVDDILVALLAGTIIYNVFSEELPRHRNLKFLWFIAGIGIYIALSVLI